MTPGVKFTRGRVPAGNPGDGAVDLGEIRRSEEIVGVLAARVATSARMLRDPAVMLLTALTADVDARDAVPEARPGVRPGPARLRRRAADIPVRASPRGMTAWVRAAAAGVAIAGVAGTTSVVAAGMLVRLARGPVSGFGRSARDWGAAARPRRAR